MDYKEKYKQALERARKWYNNPNSSSIGKSYLYAVFPELKESEDEKIRKELIIFLEELSKLGKNTNFDKWKTSDCTNWIAWLEKQNHDGKKWIYEDVYLKEKEQLIQDGIDEVLENPQKYGLEKQGEQKVTYTTTAETGDGGINALVTRDFEIPFGAKDSELHEVTYYIPEGFHAEIEGDKVVIKKGEQKPTWSEEHELNEFIRNYGISKNQSDPS